jgi:adenine-specific DNA-methyltransferase
VQAIAPSDPETRSADLLAENLEKLKALFPDILTEGPHGPAVNVDVLKALVGDATVTDADEKYGLNWHGKRRARQLALTPSTGTLRPCPGESVDWDTTQNLMIEGDNLEVLKLLQKSYAGKVKLIYIDPPYNTGKDFVYPDDFRDNIKNYLELTGQVEDGRKISSNTEASGRFHTDWMNMMYPRLKLARNLLRDDGVFLVSIDDAEAHHLRILLDLIFGPENFIGSLVWQGGRKNDARLISLGHDYVMVYARNASLLREKDTRWRERKAGLEAVYTKVKELREKHGDDYDAIHLALLRWYRELPDEHESKAHDHFSYVDQRGVYFPDNLRSPNPRPNLVFEWKGYQPHPNGWAYGREKMAELDEDNRLHYPESIEQRVKIKSYLHEHESWAPGSVFYKDRRSASKALTALMGAEVFDFPKDVDVISRLIEAITNDGDLVLDFFCGSGTTGHAVMALNKARDAKRRYILVQLPEPLDPQNKEQKIAAEFCERLGMRRTIAELTKERLRRAGRKVKEENPLFAGDLGFRVFKLDSSNIRAWNPHSTNLEADLLTHVDHLVEGRSESDILYELLLKLGLDLCVPIERRTIHGKDVHAVGGGVLMACLAASITGDDVEALAQGIVAWHQALAPAGDATCVFRDSAFADDVAKTNLTAILEQHGIRNIRSL